MATPSDPEQLKSLVGWYQGFRQDRCEELASGLDVADWLWLTAMLRDAPIPTSFRPLEQRSRAAEPHSETSPTPPQPAQPNAGSDTTGADPPTPTEKPRDSKPEPAGDERKPKPAPSEAAPTIPLLSPAALPDERDVAESLQSYSEWLVANGGQPLRLQAPPLFPSALAVLKPLKPLLIPRFSHRQRRLDEEHSAECSAALGIVWPVFRPGHQPGLRVRLVLDAGMSMVVWRHHAEELKRVLASSQSFAEVILETLPLEQLDAAVKQERRLTPPFDGSSITLLISDTAGLHWWDRRIQPWLAAVGARQPVVVIHTLPYRYRKTTALREGVSVTLSNQRQLASNSNYRKERVLSPDPWAEEEQHPVIWAPPEGAVIPVISLNPRETRPWAALAMGDKQARCPGVILPPSAHLSRRDPDPLAAKPSPEELIKGFRGLASSEAQMLLTWMAGSPAPLTLGVLRLLQGALRQEGNNAQPLAEVMVSGLLERLPGQEVVKFEELQFHAIPEVRALLQKDLDPAAHQTVLHLVTQVLERHWNRRSVGPSFEALVTDPCIELSSETKSFIQIANLTANMLDELPGQQFKRLAKKVRSSVDIDPSSGIQGLPKSIPDALESLAPEENLCSISEDGVDGRKSTTSQSNQADGQIALRQRKKPTVYVSSTGVDLKEHRAALKIALEKAGFGVEYMEKYPAFDERPLEYCLADVAASDVYVLLIAHRYGYRPAKDNPENRSITHLEYEEAGRHPGKSRLIFTVDLDHPWSPRFMDRGKDEMDLERFRSVLEQNHTVARFTTPDQLSTLVLQALQRLDLRPVTDPGRRNYTPQELQAWVEGHHTRVANAFLGLPSVQARQVHLPLDVSLTLAGAVATEGPRLLTPADLAPLLEEAGDHVLLLSGDGGAGKTSLAFAIARWWLEGKPGGVVRLPVLLETALAPGETVAERVRGWLRGQLAGIAGAAEADLAPELVEALLAAKRLVPIIDHVSELAPAAREQLLAALSPGLVVVTSRSDDDGFRERPLSRIVPQQIAVERLQAFFLNYLRRIGQGEALSDDDLMPALAHLKRIMGDKPITVLLAQMFIDDVIAHREGGLLAGSVPELMLSFVRRLDTPADPALRRRAGLEISEKVVQRALRVVGLASHRQGPGGQPLFQPLEFSEAVARAALMAEEPAGLGLGLEQTEALLAYMIELRLLLQAGAAAGRLRFPLDPLADHLAAAEQFERLEEQALLEGAGVWEEFVASLEPRPHAERERMRGFLLALRDRAMEAQSKGQRALAMPEDVPDRLAKLGFLDPEGERYRLALQRARKWVWQLGVPVASERRDAIGKLAAMAAAPEDSERRAARDVASQRLARVLAEVVPELQVERREEQQEAAVVLGLIGSEISVEALKKLAKQEEQPVELRRAGLEALGLAAKRLGGERFPLRKRIEGLLEELLRADSLDLLVKGVEGWAEHDRRLPVLQGASRGLQLAAAAELPLIGSGPGQKVPMLTLTAIKEEEGLRIRTEVVTPPVWKLPLPECPGLEPQQLELVVVPADDYTIGSPEEEVGRDGYPQFRQKCEGVNVEAQRRVSLKAYALVRHPISQAQWRAVAALPRLERDLSHSPGTYDAKGLWEIHAQPGGLAVDSVSWKACQEWLKRLNGWLKEKWRTFGGEGEPPVFGLPSESQWEAACRAGSGTPFHFGDTLENSWANCSGNYAYGLGREGLFRQRVVSTGAFGLVNRWGLAEMHGQLWEWCADQWHRDPVVGSGGDGSPLAGPDPNLAGNQEQTYRLLRGGSWIHDSRFARAAVRGSTPPDALRPDVGVRPGCFSPQGLFLYT